MEGIAQAKAKGIYTGAQAHRLILREVAGVFGPKKKLGATAICRNDSAFGRASVYRVLASNDQGVDAGQFSSRPSKGAALRAVSGRGFRRTIGPIIFISMIDSDRAFVLRPPRRTHAVSDLLSSSAR